MRREHKFEFDGIEYTYHSGTMRDREVHRAVVKKIMRACGWDSQSVPDEDNSGIYTYGIALTYLDPVKTPWWRTIGDTPESLAEGYAIFGECDEDLYDLLNQAENSVQSQKKMMQNGSKK